MMVSLLVMVEIRSKYVYDMYSVSFTISIDSKYLNREGMTLQKDKKWLKPKFKEGDPPCLKGLPRTPH